MTYHTLSHRAHRLATSIRALQPALQGLDRLKAESLYQQAIRLEHISKARAYYYQQEIQINPAIADVPHYVPASALAVFGD